MQLIVFSNLFINRWNIFVSASVLELAENQSMCFEFRLAPLTQENSRTICP